MMNRMSKQIIKVLSVGIAATLALQPVAVYAIEGEEIVTEQPAPEAFPAISGAVENAEEKVDDAIKAPAPAPKAEDGTEAKNPINAELEKTEDALENIEDSLKDIDKAIDNANKKSDTYDEKLAAADSSESAFESALDNAEPVISAAVTQTGEDAQTAENRADAVEAMADQFYADAQAATEAIEQAQLLADQAQDAANDAEEKRANAETQLGLATAAKETAAEDLSNAWSAYNEADEAVKAAKKELEDTLKEYGIYKEDGTYDMNYLNLVKKNYGKGDVYDAVSSVIEAYELANAAKTKAGNDLSTANQNYNTANQNLIQARKDKKEADDNLDQAGKDLEKAKAELEKAKLIEEVNKVRSTEVTTWNNNKEENEDVKKADKALANSLIGYKLYEEGFKNVTVTTTEDGFVATYMDGDKSVTRNFIYTIDPENYGHYVGPFWKDSVHWLIIKEVTSETEEVPNMVDVTYYTENGIRTEVDESKLQFYGVGFDNKAYYTYETVTSTPATRDVWQEKETYYVDKHGNRYKSAEIKYSNGKYYVSKPGTSGKTYVTKVEEEKYYYYNGYSKVYLTDEEKADVTAKHYGSYTSYEQSYTRTDKVTHYVAKNTEKVQQGTRPETKITETEYYKERTYYDSAKGINETNAQNKKDEKQKRYDDLLEKSKINVSDYEQALRDADEAKKAADAADKAARTKKEKVKTAKDAVIAAANALRLAKYNKTISKSELDTLQDAYDEAVIRYNTATDEYAKAAANAKDAKDQADRAQRLVASVGRVQSSGGTEDEYSPSGTSDEIIAAAPVTGPAVNQAVATEAPAVLGETRGRNASAKKASGTEEIVADDNKEEVKAAPAAKEDKTPKTPKAETQITDDETALAATPELEEKAFAWWWLLILAAIVAVSVEEYARRKSNKAKAEANDNINE